MRRLLAVLILILLALAPARAATLIVLGAGKLEPGDKKFTGLAITVVCGVYDFDSSYPNGGESFDVSSYLNRGILGVWIGPKSGYVFAYDSDNAKILAYNSAGFTPAGTNSAPTFTGSALAAHGHVLHLNDADQADDAATRVNASTNKLGANSGSDISIASVANTSGVGGIVQISAGTPAGSVSAPTFTGTAVAEAALNQVDASTDLSTVTGVPFIAFGFNY